MFYMHTLDGKPAYYSKEDGRVCLMNPVSYRNTNYLVKTLRQIRREQQESMEFYNVVLFEHGYVRVYLPEDTP